MKSTHIDRRTFVASAGALAAAPATLAMPVRARGTLADVEHVVILMQENRSFDHYFGTLRGVRGFADPRPAMLPSGRTVWEQRQDDKDGGAIVRPFHLDTRATAAGCLQSLDHSWKGSHARWKDWDVWMPEKGPFAMGYMTRADLPYYYALADQFTIADAYHCSVHGPTGPNRLYHWTGTSGLTVGRDGAFIVSNDGVDPNETADMGRDDPKAHALDWTPYAARLSAAGIRWKLYQEYDNYGDNPLALFARYRGIGTETAEYAAARAWAEGSTRANAGTSRGEHLVRAFAADVAADRLPQVAWIVAPFHMCEHPDAPPAYGQALSARLIAALAANPEVWAKTVFILNYDENDGFFDHMSPPLPATLPGMGASTVALDGEDYRGQPVGLGPRVPMLIASPWTRGGWVNSELADHTSVLRFLERRFGVLEPNISPWRRAVCGDDHGPRHYTVGAGRSLDDSWPVDIAARRTLTVTGPNGFHRSIMTGTRFTSHAERVGAATHVHLANRDTTPLDLRIASRHAAPSAGRLRLAPGEEATVKLAVLAAHRWYDVRVEAGDGTVHGLAGHWETGAPGISEPMTGAPA
ncbi:DUF756 domain-containing protein [Sphingomonas sp. CBMAI 2297]|uniref:alkaline phosphatase family protein n=1 Tax=Sphingomonas sp. CBMAI 2297 TaxID=2991720 RepID=UPI002457CAA2|nr:alkaline phosphatase family protein [Sphingomonas sp. CBMAI 2297]MDH4745910.1 DUF756 domain-containing protein [Sphingomonas sp. CBMAI 2297]